MLWAHLPVWHATLLLWSQSAVATSSKVLACPLQWKCFSLSLSGLPDLGSGVWGSDCGVGISNPIWSFHAGVLSRHRRRHGLEDTLGRLAVSVEPSRTRRPWNASHAGSSTRPSQPVTAMGTISCSALVPCGHKMHATVTSVRKLLLNKTSSPAPWQ